MGSMGTMEPIKFWDIIVETMGFEWFRLEYTNVEPMTLDSLRGPCSLIYNCDLYRDIFYKNDTEI